MKNKLIIIFSTGITVIVVYFAMSIIDNRSIVTITDTNQAQDLKISDTNQAQDLKISDTNQAQDLKKENISISSDPFQSSFSGKASYTFDNGDRYIGEFKDGNRNGQGTYIWSNGDRCEGSWKGVELNGYVKCNYINGAKYNGSFKEGKRHQYGKLIYVNGDIYEGEWVNNKREGKGKLIQVNGSFYNGDWKDDQYHGQGQYVTATYFYDGGWRNNTFHGEGTVGDGKVIDTYIFENGKKVRTVSKSLRPGEMAAINNLIQSLGGNSSSSTTRLGEPKFTGPPERPYTFTRNVPVNVNCPVLRATALAKQEVKGTNKICYYH